MENGKRKIQAKTARQMLSLRHFQFRSFLASKVVMRGKELATVTEEYTSKTCGQCGHIKQDLAGAKVFK